MKKKTGAGRRRGPAARRLRRMAVVTAGNLVMMVALAEAASADWPFTQMPFSPVALPRAPLI